jgi:hypothetical protein
MAIVTKPKKQQNDIVSSSDDPALKFIEGAGKAAAPAPEPEKSEPEHKPIMVRGIDPVLMERLDREAARRRVSRAAMVRMLLAEHLPE